MSQSKIQTLIAFVGVLCVACGAGTGGSKTPGAAQCTAQSPEVPAGQMLSAPGSIKDHCASVTVEYLSVAGQSVTLPIEGHTMVNVKDTKTSSAGQVWFPNDKIQPLYALKGGTQIRVFGMVQDRDTVLGETSSFIVAGYEVTDRTKP